MSKFGRWGVIKNIVDGEVFVRLGILRGEARWSWRDQYDSITLY